MITPTLLPTNKNRRSNVILPIVHVSRLGTDLPNPVCIARFRPTYMVIPHLDILAPSIKLSEWWRDSSKSANEWKIFKQRFWNEISERFRSDYMIMNGAAKLLADGLLTDMRGACLAFILQQVATKLKANQITLCSYESSSNAHCHMMLIYDALPETMAGYRM